MARIRYLKPEFFSDEDLAELPFQARLTFAGLWCYADKAGRLEDRPKFLKAMIFPYDNVDMEKQLDMLSNGKHENGTPFIQRYESNGMKLMQIVKWNKHQRPHHTEKESDFPPAPPLIIKGMEKGMEKQLEASKELDNGGLTVKTPLKNKTYNEFFLNFWDQYPNKKGKEEAFKAWKKYNPNMEIVINALKAQKEEKIKLREESKFCPEWPNASTWLNNKRWEDEINGSTGSDMDPLERIRQAKERDRIARGRKTSIFTGKAPDSD